MDTGKFSNAKIMILINLFKYLKSAINYLMSRLIFPVIFFEINVRLQSNEIIAVL